MTKYIGSATTKKVGNMFFLIMTVSEELQFPINNSYLKVVGKAKRNFPKRAQAQYWAKRMRSHFRTSSESNMKGWIKENPVGDYFALEKVYEHYKAMATAGVANGLPCLMLKEVLPECSKDCEYLADMLSEHFTVHVNRYGTGNGSHSGSISGCGVESILIKEKK